MAKKKYRSIHELRYEEVALAPLDSSLVGTFFCIGCLEYYPEAQTHVHHVHPEFAGGVNSQRNLLRTCDSCHGILTFGTNWKAWALTRLCENYMMATYGLRFCLQPGEGHGELLRETWLSPEFEEAVRFEFPNGGASIFDRYKLLDRIVKDLSYTKAIRLLEIKDNRVAVEQYKQELTEVSEGYFVEYPERKPLLEAEKRTKRIEKEKAEKLKNQKLIPIINTGIMKSGQSLYENDWEIGWELASESIIMKFEGTLILDK